MRHVTLKSLSYHFRGQAKEIILSGKQSIITGRNGSGKSTTINAFVWLLTGFDIQNRINFNLFDTNSAEERKRCSVIAVFDIDGDELKLTRKGEQVWSKNRDNGEMYRNGDTYEFYVNDLEVSATKYKQTIEETFGKIDKIKMMIIPNMYKMLDTKDLRNQFSDIVGEIKESDFRGDYSEVIGLIHEDGIAGAKKTFTTRISEIEKSKNKVNAKIKVLQEGLPDLSGIQEIEDKIKALDTERSEIESKLKFVSGSSEALLAKRKEQEDAISAKRDEMYNAKADYERKQKDGLRERKDAVSDAKRNNSTVTSRRKDIAKQIADYKERIKASESRVEYLLKQYAIVRSRMFDKICPECGGEYSGTKLAEVLQRFTAKKEAEIATIVDEGQSERQRIEETKSKIVSLQNEHDSITNINVETLEKAVYEYKKTMLPFDASAYEKQIAEMEANKVIIPVNEEVITLQTRLGDITSEIIALNKDLSNRNVYERDMKNIKQSEREREQLEKDMATNMRMKALVEEYQREYAEIIKDRANLKFDRVVVEMVQPNKSGGLDDVCNLKLNGVSNSNNSAGEMVIGCEVCEAFQRHYGISMPLFIDNAESVNEVNIPKHDGQVILLVVSDGEFEVQGLGSAGSIDGMRNAYKADEREKRFAALEDGRNREERIAALKAELYDLGETNV